MNVLLALIVAMLLASASYLMLRRSLIKLIFGLFLLSLGTNVFLFAAGGLVEGHPPIIQDEETVLAEPYADPLPQALILTAIVIGFGVQAFAVVLARETHAVLGSDDLDEMWTTDSI